MLHDQFKNYRLILASASPRRQHYFKELGLEFEIRLKPVDEIYPKELEGKDIARYLAQLKASPFKVALEAKEILITSDTVVWHKGVSLAKASTTEEAFKMLERLSNDWHEVITAVAFTTSKTQRVIHHSTKVKFKILSKPEIRYYIENYKPFDKAGAYGIQEWIGLIGIEEIQGSYSNVVGLPTQQVYETLMKMVS